MRQLSRIEEECPTGARPILMYVIAVDDNGTREGQKNLSSIGSFDFIDQDEQNFNHDSKFTEFVETSFQHYSYGLPKLEEEAEGDYILTLGCQFAHIYACMYTHTMHTHARAHV